MKTRFHQFLLGVTIVLLSPACFLAMILSYAAIASGLATGFRSTDYLAIGVMLLAIIIFMWALRLFWALRHGFDSVIRLKLIAFYLIVASYCGFWLVSSASRDGRGFSIFSFDEQVFGGILLLLPVLLVLFSKPYTNAAEQGAAANP